MAFRSPIGISDFQKLRKAGAYYVDKTALITQLLTQDTEVTLFPRPRRFGKTLMMSTLRYFFEISDEDRAWMYEDMAVWKSQQAREHFQKHPVINLSFKNIKSANWEQMFEGARTAISEEVKRHAYLLRNPAIDEDDRAKLGRLKSERSNSNEVVWSVGLLSKLLEQHHGAKPVILLDEYDVPIQAAWRGGFYDEAIAFFRDFMAATFKDNEHLYRGVLTGVLRVSKESMFSGANNIKVHSIFDEQYATSFGFTQEEVDAISDQLDEPDAAKTVREWYNGYRFGGHVVYNSWSVLNYAVEPKVPKAYWVFTGADDVLRQLVLSRPYDMTEALKKLMEGEALPKLISVYVSLRDIEHNAEAVWSLLVSSGYLTFRDEQWIRGRVFANLVIPNLEVQVMFEENIIQWLEQAAPNGQSGVQDLLAAMFSGDEETFGQVLTEVVDQSFSYHVTDKRTPERVYQAFILGLVVHLRDYFYVRTERQSGRGRYDLALVPKHANNHSLVPKPWHLVEKSWLRKGVVFEFKAVDGASEQVVEKSLDEAMEQIEKLHYDTDLQESGAVRVVKWGVVFDGKRVWVRGEK